MTAAKRTTDTPATDVGRPGKECGCDGTATAALTELVEELLARTARVEDAVRQVGEHQQWSTTVLGQVDERTTTMVETVAGFMQAVEPAIAAMSQGGPMGMVKALMSMGKNHG